MDQSLIGLALAAGMMAALNPCGFAMLPAYLTFVVDTGGAGRAAAVRRAVFATAAMALGFLTVFVSFGLLAVSVAGAIQKYVPFATIAVGVVLVALGVWLLCGRELKVPAAALPTGGRWAPGPRLWSMYGYGIAYAVASLSCTVGPFLAVTGTSFRGGGVAGGLAVYVAYAAGLTLVVGALAVGVAFASSAVLDRMRAVLPYVNRISGAVLVLVGAYVGYYGLYEVRLLAAGGNLDDPVIAAAGRLQRSVAGWVYQHGAWPWIATMGVVVAVSAVAAVRRRARDRR